MLLLHLPCNTSLSFLLRPSLVFPLSILPSFSFLSASFLLHCLPFLPYCLPFSFHPSYFHSSPFPFPYRYIFPILHILISSVLLPLFFRSLFIYLCITFILLPRSSLSLVYTHSTTHTFRSLTPATSTLLSRTHTYSLYTGGERFGAGQIQLATLPQHTVCL